MNAVNAVTIASTGKTLYALRSDGAVFVLIRRGDLLPDGVAVKSPFWANIPAVPGTEAAKEQAG